MQNGYKIGLSASPIARITISVMMVRHSAAASQLFLSNPRLGNAWLNVFAVYQAPVKFLSTKKRFYITYIAILVIIA